MTFLKISNKNLMLFICGNAMSRPPSTSGTSQFLKPPIMIAKIMKKKIVTEK